MQPLDELAWVGGIPATAASDLIRALGRMLGRTDWLREAVGEASRVISSKYRFAVRPPHTMP